MDLTGYLRRIMNQSAAETFDPTTDSLEAIANALGIGPSVGLWMFGVCDPAMVGSQTVIVTNNLTGLPDDIFNGQFWMQVILNHNAHGVAPEGEFRRITNFVAATQTFTVDAFSANVEANDLVCIFHESLLGHQILGVGTLTASSATVPADNARTEGDDYWRGCMLMPTEGACAFQPRLIVDYTGATGVFTLDPSNPFTAAPGLVDYVILKGQIQPSYDAIAFGTLDTSSTTVPADSTRAGLYAWENNDYFKGCLLMPVAGNCRFQPRPIRGYVAATGVFTLDEPFSQAPGNVDYVILRSAYPVQRLLDIFNAVNAMLTLTETGGTLTADGTEQNLYINNLPAGEFDPRVVFVDLDNMAAGDTTVFRVYYRLNAGGGLQLYDYIQYNGADGGLPNGRKLISIALLPNRFGVQVTLQQTAGVNKAYDWDVHYGV
jgi:hypothetical protein